MGGIEDDALIASLGNSFEKNRNLAAEEIMNSQSHELGARKEKHSVVEGLKGFGKFWSRLKPCG